MARTIAGTDTGGTFTDLVVIADGRLVIHKLLSTPDDPSRAVVDGLVAMGVGADALIAHGTTVATNALLERKGARTALVTTAGFEDVIQIGRQARTRLYDLEYASPEPLVPPELRFGVQERVGADGEVILALRSADVEEDVLRVEGSGAKAVAISLLFSFLQPEHEMVLRDALAAKGLYVTASSDLIPEFREFERTSTTVVNSYVGPVMSGYLDRLDERVGRSLRVMQSSGGSISVNLARREPVRTVLSGPAGGVVGAAFVAGLAGFEKILTFDMGGTSTDVALHPGRVQTSTGHAIDDMPIGVPGIDIHTVGAGGGSIARVDEGRALRVGPDSAGADPGPACYGKGDLPTVTDANLLLGRMLPSRFLGGRMAIDETRAEGSVATIADGLGLDVYEAALGIVRVANAVMERALRNVSLERGFDPRDFTVVPFGGAGPQHACELAEELDIRSVLVPRYPGVLSALGVAIADVAKDYSQTVLSYGSSDIERTAIELEQRALAELAGEGYEPSSIVLRRSLDARYKGQSFELPIDWHSDDLAAIADNFHVTHEARFGYANRRAAVEVVNVRVHAVVATERPTLERDEPRPHKAQPVGRHTMRFAGGPAHAAVYDRDTLAPGATFDGPALVTQMDATTVVPPGWRGEVDAYRNLLLRKAQA